MVQRASSYTDQNFGLTDLRLGNVFIAEFLWAAELAKQDSLQSRSKLFANKVWFKLHTRFHVGCLHLFRTDSQRTFILEEPFLFERARTARIRESCKRAQGEHPQVYWYVMNAKEQTVG